MKNFEAPTTEPGRYMLTICRKGSLSAQCCSTLNILTDDPAVKLGNCEDFTLNDVGKVTFTNTGSELVTVKRLQLQLVQGDVYECHQENDGTKLFQSFPGQATTLGCFTSNEGTS